MGKRPLIDERDELNDEIARLRKVISALVERAENGDGAQGSDFSLFRNTALLEDQVRQRTRALNETLRELEAANRALRDSRAKFQAIFDLMPAPVLLTQRSDGVVLDVSRSFAEFCGYRPDELIGRRVGSDDLGFWIDPAERLNYLTALDAGGGAVAGLQTRFRRGDGRIADVVVSGRTINVDGRDVVVTEFHDNTDAVRHAHDLQRIAERDALTGLPNRRLIQARLARACIQARRDRTVLAICYLDLDGFKAVNDTFGHQAGDAVLIEAGRRLSAIVRSSDTVGRLGGDEFAILLTGLASGQGCEDVLRRAVQWLGEPYCVEGGEIHRVGASIGVTLYPEDDSGAEQLLEHADQALYLAKREGKNCFRCYVTS